MLGLKLMHASKRAPVNLFHCQMMIGQLRRVSYLITLIALLGIVSFTLIVNHRWKDSRIDIRKVLN